MSDKRLCRDGGTCHHACEPDECFREKCCEPFSDYDGPWGDSYHKPEAFPDFPDKPSQCRACFVPNADVLDGGFLIYFTPLSHSLQFFVLDVQGRYENGTPMFDVNGNTADPTDPDSVEPLMNGGVKWDGCIDLDIGGDDTSYRNHFCGLEDALVLERAMRAIYALAAEHIEAFDPELAA